MEKTKQDIIDDLFKIIRPIASLMLVNKDGVDDFAYIIIKGCGYNHEEFIGCKQSVIKQQDFASI
jgi:hypothetical protein